jgi:EAL domain-containing protein (putative c-di-GMP-specific phosphodiesterase class I)
MDTTLPEAEQDDVFAKLHAILSEDIPWDGGVLSVGASIGYAGRTKDATTLSMLLKSADSAMRRAKHDHQSWARFNPDIDGAALDYPSQEIQFRSALARGDLRAALQPIADASTLEVSGFELLSRWTKFGALTMPEPTEFIPIAQRLGLLNELLWTTLDEALQSAELNPRRLSVNVSPAQLQAPDFVEHFLNLLKRHSVHPSHITLEVTEQVAYRNIEANIQVLEKARRAGLLIALDDFGTGYSSLSIVDRLPLDKIKIDKSFSQQAGSSARTDSVLRASIRLASELKLICCVEGIETEEAARKVALLGADEIQGYWIGKPRIVQETRALFKRAS